MVGKELMGIVIDDMKVEDLPEIVSYRNTLPLKHPGLKLFSIMKYSRLLLFHGLRR